MLHTREDLPLCCAVALQFIGDEDTWDVLAPLEELAEKLLGGVLIPPSLYQDVEHHAILIYGPPQIMPFLVDREEHFIQMPLITRPGTPATQLVGVLLAKLATPPADGFVGDDDTADEQELFHVTMAQRKAEIQPDGMADDLTGESMTFVEIGRS